MKGGLSVYQMIIIDDESLVLEYLTKFINSEFPEINVTAIFDVSSNAINYLKTHAVDIVLTDISMPEPTGIDIAEFCHKSMPNTLVIFLSAYKEFEYARSAISFNVHDYILKPLSKQHLIKSLSSAINILGNRSSLSGITGFASDEYILSCQAVFSDLVCDCITDELELKDKLSSIGLPPSMMKNQGVTINLYIANLNDYLNNIWKHGKTSLFDTLLRLICKETNRVFFAPIWYTQNKIEIIGISKKSDISYEQILADFEVQIKNELTAVLKLDSKVSITKKFTSAKSLISADKNTDLDADLIKKFYEYIEKNYKNHISLEDVAKHFNFSRVYFSAYYKKCTGENFSTTLSKVRISKAKELLQNPNVKISVVMREVGYNHSTHFHKTFKNIVGCSPSEYQKLFGNQ